MRFSLVHDEANNLFDRSYAFDQAGRLTQALTGHEARGEQFGPLSAYNETFQYDAFGNTTGRNTRWWSHQYNAGTSYQNNRQPADIYDSDGRVLADHQNTSYSKTINYTYDVRGLKTSARQGDNSNSATHDYDGDGQRVKIVATLTENSVTTTTTTYEISSSVLAGAVIEEVDAQGTKTAQHVYTSSGIELASGKAETTMVFKHRDPVTSVEQLSWTNAANSGRTEFDPLAGDVGEYEPVEDDPGRDFPMSVSHPSEPMNLCVLDGLPSDCPAAQSFGRESSKTVFMSWMDAPHDSVAMLRFYNRSGEERRLAGYLQLMPDGGMGYVPIGATFDGDLFSVPLDNGANGMGFVSQLYAGGMMNFNPQNRVQGPREIHTNPKNQNCFISVSFEQGTFYDTAGNLPNGPSTYEGNYGLGFTVSGKVGRGGVGKIGDDPNPENSKGTATIFQLTADYIESNGRVLRDLSLHSDFNTKSNYEATGNTFSWYDHPDSPTPGNQITGYVRKMAFQVSVKNGNHFCSKTFSAIFTFNGQWSTRWQEGYGYYK